MYIFSHVTISTDLVIDKPDLHTLGVECFNQVDHIGSVTAKAVKIIHRDDITFIRNKSSPYRSVELPNALSIKMQLTFTPAI